MKLCVDFIIVRFLHNPDKKPTKYIFTLTQMGQVFNMRSALYGTTNQWWA